MTGCRVRVASWSSTRTSPFRWPLVFLVALGLAACSEPEESSPPTGGQNPVTRDTDRPLPGDRPPPLKNPLDDYIEQAGAFLAATQSAGGSWSQLQSPTPDFANPEPQANLFGTTITLLNLTRTSFEDSPVFEQGVAFLRRRMDDGFCWSFYEAGRFGKESWSEPDADTTALALIVVSGRLEIPDDELKKLRAIFDRHRTADGLYLTYFDGFYAEKGFLPHPNVPSLGVNLNVLGFFGRYALDRSRLLDGLRGLMQGERYWEKTPSYHSLAVLAYLASNAVEHGAPEAEELLRRLLEDFATTQGEQISFPALDNAELAAYVKARSHLCLLERDPCRELHPAVAELAGRRKRDGSWDPAPLYEYDFNKDALGAFLERRDFVVPRTVGAAGYDVERALASPGTTRYYDGSREQTTSLALKALVVFRELASRRAGF